MKLGDGFSAAFTQAWIRSRLSPGAVIKLQAQMDDGKLHEKRFVVVAVDERTVTLVINSEIGPFLKARPALLACQASIRAETHDFMDHDSHVDCSRTRVYPTGEVITQLMDHRDWVLGRINGDLRDEIIASVKRAPTLSAQEVERLCKMLAEC
jgi:hypothetical protein